MESRIVDQEFENILIILASKQRCAKIITVSLISVKRKKRAVACPIRRESLFTKNLTTHRPAPNTFLKGLVQALKISERNGTSKD
jgi:hypothetical protein